MPPTNKQVNTASYSFATNGGAVGTIGLLAAASAALIPAGSTVTDVRVRVLVPTAGAAGSRERTRLSLSIGAAQAMVASGVEQFPWPTAGSQLVLRGGTLLLAVDSDVNFSIGGQPLTAGQFTVYVEYHS